MNINLHIISQYHQQQKRANLENNIKSIWTKLVPCWFFISFTFANCLLICNFNGSTIVAHLNFLPASLFSGSCLSTGLLSNFMYAVVVTTPLKWSLFEKYARFLSGGSVSFVWVAPRLLSPTRWLLGHVTVGSCFSFV